ncbi:MAG: hypothetical protein ACRDJN_05895 [Chloroflexota bacterium]
MNLMLTVIFACVALGLFLPRFTAREQLLIAAIAVVMTALYYFPQRFM